MTNNSGFNLSAYNPILPVVPVRSESEQALDTSLQSAARKGDFVALRVLVKKGACIHALGESGMTPLREALRGGRQFIHKEQRMMAPVGSDRDEVRKLLSKCKILVDLGAIPDREDFQIILDYLEDISANNTSTVLAFVSQRPNPGEPQLFINGRFKSLDEVTEAEIGAQTKDIVLFIIADEYFNANYGPVSLKFSPGLNNTYQAISNHFTFIRALADSSAQLPSIVERVNKTFSHLVIIQAIFDGHANPRLMAFGEFDHPPLTRDDRSLMRRISRGLSPKARIDLTGCSCAKGAINNLACTFSKQSGGRPVSGSEGITTQVLFIFGTSWRLAGPILFALPEDKDKVQMKTYVKGKIVASIDVPTKSIKEPPQELIQALESRWTFQYPQICNAPTRLYDDYFTRV